MTTPAALVHELRWVHSGPVPDEVLRWFHRHPHGCRAETASRTTARHLRGLSADVHVVAPLPGHGGGGVPCPAPNRADVDVLAGPGVAVLFGPGTAGWAQRWQRGGLRGAPLRRLVARRRAMPAQVGALPWSPDDWVVVETERRRRGALHLDSFHLVGPDGGSTLWSPAVELPPGASAAALGLVARRLLADFPLPDRLGPWAAASFAAWLAETGTGVATPTATAG